MKKPAIRAIFVDFGNVCATLDFGRFIKNFSKAAKVSRKAIETVLLEKKPRQNVSGGYAPLFLALERGEIGPTGFFCALTHILDCANRIDFDTFARLWVDIFDRENMALDKLLRELSQKKFLLSNTNTIVHGRHIANCEIVRRNFPSRAERILSYEVGEIKPNPLIYNIAFAKAGTKPEESLFLDDMPENIEAWRALGGIGVVYNARTDSIRKLRTELRALGVLK